MLKDCEVVFEMVNNEIDKVNKVVCDVKVKVVELDVCVYQIEGEFKLVMDRVVGFECELRIYCVKYFEVKFLLSEKDFVIGGKESKISSLLEKVCLYVLIL